MQAPLNITQCLKPALCICNPDILTNLSRFPFKVRHQSQGHTMLGLIGGILQKSNS